jgi:hypothetical protein
MSKFDAYEDKFDQLRKEIDSKRKEADQKKTGGFDTSWKFSPKLPDNKTKIEFKVRILPNVHADTGSPWSMGLFHMYKRKDGQFIYAFCPKNVDIKSPCPMCEKAQSLYDTKDEMDKKEAGKIYKKKRYFMNVLVLEDPRTGEENQEGQVLIWEFGKQIYDILEEMTNRKCNFYHPIKGRDFNLVIKRNGPNPTYTSSMFDMDESPISEDSDRMDEVFDAIHDIDKKIFSRGPQSYDKLVERMTGVRKTTMEDTPSSENEESSVKDTDSSEDKEVSDADIDLNPEEEEKKEETATETSTSEDSGDDDDFDFDFDE